MCGSVITEDVLGIKPPKMPELPKPPDAPATEKSPQVGQARTRARQAALSATGRSSTILTGPGGALGAAGGQRKTLLGS